ncbi:MAG TPA: DUF3667 domain-containing protein [Longimicrobium sp.]|nr:DUF3667 domain-containing protein [Longimicrobium sp.]
MAIAPPAAPLRVPIFRATERKTPDRPCTNCGDPTPGNFCRNCGQRKVEVQVSLRRMVLEVLDDQFALNSALPRTVGALFFRPGHLTREYMNGRIARYIPPFRLYLVASVVFFVVLSMLPELRDPLANTNINRDTTVTVGANGRGVGTHANPLQRPVPPVPVAPRAGDLVRAAGDSGAAARMQPRVMVPPPRPAPPKKQMSFLDGVKFKTGNEQIDSLLNERLGHFKRMDPRDASRQLIRGYLDHVPQMMFIMLPLFAALLKLLYAGSRRFYVEHFVFALHLHAFAFTSYLAMIVLRWPPLVGALWLWMFVYLYVAMKRVYRQGWVTTAVKYGVLGATYFVAVIIAGFLTFLATVLTA